MEPAKWALVPIPRWTRFKRWWFNGLAPDLDIEIDGVRIVAPGRFKIKLDAQRVTVNSITWRSGGVLELASRSHITVTSGLLFKEAS